MSTIWDKLAGLDIIYGDNMDWTSSSSYMLDQVNHYTMIKGTNQIVSHSEEWYRDVIRADAARRKRQLEQEMLEAKAKKRIPSLDEWVDKADLPRHPLTNSVWIEQLHECDVPIANNLVKGDGFSCHVCGSYWIVNVVEDFVDGIVDKYYVDSFVGWQETKPKRQRCTYNGLAWVTHSFKYRWLEQPYQFNALDLRVPFHQLGLTGSAARVDSTHDDPRGYSSIDEARANISV